MIGKIRLTGFWSLGEFEHLNKISQRTRGTETSHPKGQRGFFVTMAIPTPRSDETQHEFVGRCNSELSGEFPETDQRNAVCFDAWRGSKESTELQRLAAEKFPNDKFTILRDVAIVDEFDATEDDDEEPVIYDRDKLVEVVAVNNERIRDTGDFTPITDGHTVDDPEVKDPDILGFAGNFRLGQIGNVNPRAAIFVDQYVPNEHIDRVRSLPRHSVELWPSSSLIDPIARLGATTPKRDLGLSLSKSGGFLIRLSKKGQKVVRYQMPSQPTSTNVFIPTFGSEKEQCTCPKGGPCVCVGFPEEAIKNSMQRLKLQEIRDPDAVCGDIWFNGTDEQRGSFGEGTEGRGRDEQPPDAWFTDCLSTIKMARKEPKGFQAGIGLEGLIRNQEGEWVPFVGPRGGKGWQNTVTGEIVRGDKPGDATPEGPPSEEDIEAGMDVEEEEFMTEREIKNLAKERGINAETLDDIQEDLFDSTGEVLADLTEGELIDLFDKVAEEEDVEAEISEEDLAVEFGLTVSVIDELTENLLSETDDVVSIDGLSDDQKLELFKSVAERGPDEGVSRFLQANPELEEPQEEEAVGLPEIEIRRIARLEGLDAEALDDLQEELFEETGQVLGELTEDELSVLITDRVEELAEEPVPEEEPADEEDEEDEGEFLTDAEMRRIARLTGLTPQQFDDLQETLFDQTGQVLADLTRDEFEDLVDAFEPEADEDIPPEDRLARSRLRNQRLSQRLQPTFA